MICPSEAEVFLPHCVDLDLILPETGPLFFSVMFSLHAAFLFLFLPVICKKRDKNKDVGLHDLFSCLLMLSTKFTDSQHSQERVEAEKKTTEDKLKRQSEAEEEKQLTFKENQEMGREGAQHI